MAETDLTDFINAALIVLGCDPVATASPAAGNKLERALFASADACRQELLQKQRWTAALKSASVSVETNAEPPPGYTSVGALPADTLIVWDCSAADFTRMAENRMAWCGAGPVRIVYGANIAYAKLDRLLQRACATRLAAQNAKVLTDRAADLKVYNELALQAEMAAASSDAVSRREAPLLGNNWSPDTPNTGRRLPWLGDANG